MFPARYPGEMKVARGCAALESALGRKARSLTVAIGNFDGVHRGHQALLGACRTAAAAAKGDWGVLTFDPHPARFFAPALAPPMIVTLARRLELLAEAGADFAVVEPFTAALAALEAERFVEEVLKGSLDAHHVVVGYDFSFGRGRRGDGRLLTGLGQSLGIEVTIVPAVQVDGLTCSSTKIREFVLEGRVEGAKLLLGRPFALEGEVVHGAGRGRGLGVPTANLRPDGELYPRNGIYAARAQRTGGPDATVYLAAVSIGTNPTFQAAAVGKNVPVTVEAHLLDFDGDLYGARLRVELEARLRDEARFASVDELVAQIKRDIIEVREVLS